MQGWVDELSVTVARDAPPVLVEAYGWFFVSPTSSAYALVPDRKCPGVQRIQISGVLERTEDQKRSILAHELGHLTPQTDDDIKNFRAERRRDLLLPALIVAIIVVVAIGLSLILALARSDPADRPTAVVLDAAGGLVIAATGSLVMMLVLMIKRWNRTADALRQGELAADVFAAHLIGPQTDLGLPPKSAKGGRTHPPNEEREQLIEQHKTCRGNGRCVVDGRDLFSRRH